MRTFVRVCRGAVAALLLISGCDSAQDPNPEPQDGADAGEEDGAADADPGDDPADTADDGGGDPCPDHDLAAPVLLGERLNPVPGQGEERGTNPFQWVRPAWFGSEAYLLAGRCNTFDLWRVAAEGPMLVAQSQGRPRMRETGDWDCHLRDVAVMDRHPELYAVFMNLGSHTLVLDPAAAPTAASVTQEYPAGFLEQGDWLVTAGMVRDRQGRVLVVRHVPHGPLGLFRFDYPSQLVQVASLPVADTLSGGFVALDIGPRAFVAAGSASQAGRLHLVDVSDTSAMQASALDPPAGYASLTDVDLDRERAHLALSYWAADQRPLVVVIGLATGEPVEIARGTLEEASTGSQAFVGIRDGFVAASAQTRQVFVPDLPTPMDVWAWTTYLARVSVPGPLAWGTDALLEELEAQANPAGNPYSFRFDLLVPFALAGELLLYRAGGDLEQWWRLPVGLAPVACPPSCPDARSDTVVCSAEGVTCGAAHDACGRARSCDHCPPGFHCDGQACALDCADGRGDAEVCAGAPCGGVPDGCGRFRPCGFCGAGQTCREGNTCAPVCLNDAIAESTRCVQSVDPWCWMSRVCALAADGCIHCAETLCEPCPGDCDTLGTGQCR